MPFVSAVRSRFAACVFLTLGCAMSVGQAMADDLTAKAAEPGELRLGLDPWIGYGPWLIADQKGIFKKNGLNDVRLENFNEDKDRMAAFASGQVDFMNVPAHTALHLVESGVKLKIVLLLDFSLSADAVIADNVKSIADLKGKKVAYEESSTSDILLNYALAQGGMSLKDVVRVPMPAAQAGAALVAGQVPVAVTYEPYLSAAMAQNKDTHLIYTAGQAPGLISDVLVVSDKALAEKPGQVMALVKSWNDAMNEYKQHTKASRALIAKGVGSSEVQLETAFNGVQFYDVNQNKTTLGGDFSSRVLPEILKSAVQANILKGDANTASLVDSRFVKAVK
jgi:NitT/TauT family transport system substrate-binding protein